MKLAIKGHPKRGNEVIGILEMLGGINKLDLKGTEDYSYYYIDDSSNNIYCVLSLNPQNCIGYTLEEFLEKFPYKVGDKVKAWINGYCSICNIRDMKWDSIVNEIKYKIQDYWYSTMNLQPYKEETMEEDKKAKKYCTEESEDSGKTKKIAWFAFWDNDFADEVELYLEDRELVQKDSKWFIVKKKKKYPKTYEECYNILSEFNFTNPEKYDFEFDWRCTIKNKYYGKLMQSFVKLLICRDAYWKIAGEQMGLGKDWEQNYCDRCFTIINNKGNIYTCEYHGNNNVILAFPTEEMRDAFYENFKELIENCKELL